MKIKCAAIKRNDRIIVEGYDHAVCIQKSPLGTCKGKGYVQGFVTDTGKFVDRKEAAKIAFEAGQIPKPVTILFSEDLTGNWPWKKSNDSK